VAKLIYFNYHDTPCGEKVGMSGRFREPECLERPPHQAKLWFSSVRVALSPQAGRGKLRHVPPPYSALAPEALTTLAHFSVSAATRAPNAAGLKGIGSLPTSASRALMVGSASPALIT
jgi:hypothetical protein